MRRPRTRIGLLGKWLWGGKELLDQNTPKSLATVSALVGASALVMTQAFAAGDRLDVHEWGTFTSIVGTDGGATGWFALGGPNDLPCFVHRLENNGSLKAGLIGSARMETPVFYFYTQRDLWRP